MAKDRAAPFSKKHRRYWIPVTGGMVLIGLVNTLIGVCTYEPAGDVEPIRLAVPGDDAAATLGVGQIPAAIMREFVDRYPKIVPIGANLDEGNYVVLFPEGATKRRATFRPDGTFISDE